MDTRALLLCGMAAWLVACHATSRASAEASPPAPVPPPPAVEASIPAPAPAAAPDPGPAAEPERPIDVTLRVEARPLKGPPKFIDSDEALRSGDRVALHVSVSEPSYVYVGHRGANGKRAIIYPRSGDQLFSPGANHRIPAPGQWFKLDRDTGHEDIFLYASRKPLGSDEAAQLLESDSARWNRTQARVVRNKPHPRSKPGPMLALADDAPGQLAPEDRGLVVEEPADIEVGTELTRAHFVIRHRK